jgi:phosphatidylglycerol:prolipoprotein diacylglycerol transferase
MSDTTHWVHDLSPFAIQFSEGVGIRWYGLAYLAGLLWGWWLLRRWAAQGRVPLEAPRISDFVLACGLGMIIGGRLGYVLLYEPHLLWEFGGGVPWWGLLAVNHGGMASHGGLIGLAAGAWWFCRRNRVSVPLMVDLVAATAPIGVLLGRLANFVNGELWGRPTEVSWGVIFPDAAEHPAKLVGRAAYDWQVSMGIENLARHPSQLYGAMVEGLLPFLIALPFHARHRKPGLTTGLVLVLYGIGRFVDEFFRMPDMGQPGGPAAPGHDPVPAILGFMSKGQFYTLPLILAGALLLWWAARRPARPELYQRG